MIKIQQIEYISANYKITIEYLYYSSIRHLKHIEHKFHQIVARYKAEYQKVIELQEK